MPQTFDRRSWVENQLEMSIEFQRSALRFTRERISRPNPVPKDLSSAIPKVNVLALFSFPIEMEDADIKEHGWIEVETSRI
jgi:hypothetical protein